MPRLAMSRIDANDLAAYLAPAVPTASEAPTDLRTADLGKGRQLLETKGCGACHAFSGVALIPSSTPPAMNAAAFARAYQLAPDLRVTRRRMSASQLVAWLKDPASIKSDTAMPKVALEADEVNNLAGYILNAELARTPTRAAVARLPILARKVTYKEVDERVFHRTCWHCHSEPDYAIGDGGPGNSGGFGFLSGQESAADQGLVDEVDGAFGLFELVVLDVGEIGVEAIAGEGGGHARPHGPGSDDGNGFDVFDTHWCLVLPFHRTRFQ